MTPGFRRFRAGYAGVGVTIVKRWLVGILAGMLFIPATLCAQFIGYVSPQTTQQTLATAATCTGSPVVYPINNLGQTQHLLTLISSAAVTMLSAEIDGIDRAGNIFRISDLLESAGLGTKGGSLAGSGYYPQFQAVVTCTGAGTYTLSYSGASAQFVSLNGTYLTAQIDKVNFSGLSATATQTDPTSGVGNPTPFGSSAGTLYFRYSAAPTTVGTLAITCVGSLLSAGGPINVATFTLANTTVTQTYNVPDASCMFFTLTYTPGTGGTVVSAEYVFAVPGVSVHASTDPCLSGAVPKIGIAVTAGAAGTTLILAGTATTSIYICGYQLSQAVAGTFQWVYGTGPTCGTGTQSVTGAMTTALGIPFVFDNGSGYISRVPITNSLCLTTTGAGASAAGIVTVIQAP